MTSCLTFITPVVWRCGQASSGGGITPYAYQWWFFWSQWLPWLSCMGRSWGNCGANTAYTRLCSKHCQGLRSTRSPGQSKDVWVNTCFKCEVKANVIKNTEVSQVRTVTLCIEGVWTNAYKSMIMINVYEIDQKI